MRNAAAVLGIIAGVIGMFVGLFGYGWTSLVAENPEVGEVLFNFDSPRLRALRLDRGAGAGDRGRGDGALPGALGRDPAGGLGAADVAGVQLQRGDDVPDRDGGARRGAGDRGRPAGRAEITFLSREPAPSSRSSESGPAPFSTSVSSTKTQSSRWSRITLSGSRSNQAPMVPASARVADDVGERLHHDEADHAERGEPGEQAEDDQRGQDEFGQRAGGDHGPVEECRAGRRRSRPPPSRAGRSGRRRRARAGTGRRARRRPW